MKHNKLFLILLSIFTIFLFKENIAVKQSILTSCELFFTKLFPSLFPMMILADLFLYLELPELLSKSLGIFFSKIFSISHYAVFAFLISCFSGSPSNAYIIKNLVQENYISEEEASKVLSFSFFSNPLFLYTMLSYIFPNQLFTIIKLILIPYFVNILIGITLPNIKTEEGNIRKKEKESFGIMFTKSIKNAMNTLLFILGTVSIFLLINTIFNPFHIPIISGFLEISQGLNTLISIQYSQKIKEILAMFFISFGGLSIHLQIQGILSDTNISYLSFLKGRIKQTILSFILIFMI